MPTLDKNEILEKVDFQKLYLSYLADLKISASGWSQARCPFPDHPDIHPSFRVNINTGAFKCHGCGEKGDIIKFIEKAEGLDFVGALAFLEKFNGKGRQTSSIQAQKQSEIIYDYRDENNVLRHQTVRKIPKAFKQRSPDNNGGYMWNLKGVKTVIYNLPDVIKNDTVYIVEGEKDVENLKSAFGVCATTNAGGAGRWIAEYNKYFENKTVIIIPDNDRNGTGEKHAINVANNLFDVAESVKITRLPDLYKDISEFIKAGGTRQQFDEMVASAPLYEREEEMQVDDSALLPLIPFPFEVLPVEIREYITSLSKAMSIPADFAASCTLPIIGAMLGNNLHVSPSAGWAEPPFVWLLAIGETGSGKSPLINELMKSVNALQLKTYDKYIEEKKGFDEIKNAARFDPDTEIPPEPVLRHYKVSDFTIECLVDIFEQDPRGVLIYRDELAGFFNAFDQYKGGRGNDKQQIIELYNCHSLKVDRKKKTSVTQASGASIIGGIQPEPLRRLMTSASFDEGLFPRFLMVNLKNHPKKFNRDGVPNSKYWPDLIRWCAEINLDIKTKFSAPAVDIFDEFYTEFHRLKPFLSKNVSYFIPKLIAHSLRLTATLHIMNSYPDVEKLRRPVDKNTVIGAIKLTRFFGGQVVKTLEIYNGKPGEPELDELEKRLLQVLKDVEPLVNNGRIKFKTICERFNADLPPAIKHTPERLRVFLKKMGLKTQKGADNLSFLIWETSKIEKLITVSTVSTVSSREKNTGAKVNTDILETNEYEVRA